MESPDYFSLKSDELKIKNFKSRNVEDFSKAQGVHVSSRWLVESYLQCDFGHAIHHFLVQKIHNLFHHSIIQCMADQPQIAFGSARMATEAFRDLCRIHENNENLDLFLMFNPSKNERKRYKSVFRFDVQNLQEYELFKLYNLASTFGIHAKYAMFDEMGSVEANFGGNQKRVTQKDHSIAVCRLIIGCQFTALRRLYKLCGHSLDASGSPYVRLFNQAMSKVAQELKVAYRV